MHPADEIRGTLKKFPGLQFEVLTLVPLVGMAVWIGIYPNTFLNMLHAPAQNILTQVQPYMAAHNGGLLHLASLILGGH